MRDRVSDKLQRMIQTGGEGAGHSSVEDAAATLDLVRWWIVNEKPKRAHTTKITSNLTSVSGNAEASGAK